MAIAVGLIMHPDLTSPSRWQHFGVVAAATAAARRRVPRILHRSRRVVVSVSPQENMLLSYSAAVVESNRIESNRIIQ